MPHASDRAAVLSQPLTLPIPIAFGMAHHNVPHVVCSATSCLKMTAVIEHTEHILSMAPHRQ